jgi:hypothetical protein
MSWSGNAGLILGADCAHSYTPNMLSDPITCFASTAFSNKITRQRRQPFELAFGPAEYDGDVLILSELAETYAVAR